MLTRQRHIVTAAAALSLLGVLLTGCSAAGNTVTAGSMPFAAPATAQATEATPTPTAIPGDTDGNGKLSEFEKQILAKNAVRDYTMPDGSIVKIDPTQPLPDAVVAVLQAKSAATAEALRVARGQALGDASQVIYDVVRADAEATGKQLVYVFEVNNQTASGDEVVWASQPSGVSSTGLDVTPDKDAFMASVEAWATPRNYEIVVIQ